MPTTDRVKYAHDSSSDTPVKSGTLPTTQQGVTPTPTSYMDDINYHRTAHYFDLSLEERKNVRIAEKLSYLTDWAMAKLESKNHVEALSELKRMTMQLGLTDKGDSLIKKLYEFARLDAQRQKIEKELDMYKKEEPPKPEPEVKETKLDTKDLQKIVKDEIQSVSKDIKSSLKSHITKNANKQVEEKKESQPEPLSNYMTQ